MHPANWLPPARRSIVKIGEATEFGGNGSSQLVVTQPQLVQVGQAADLGRYRPAELVVAEVQPDQMSKAVPIPAESPR